MSLFERVPTIDLAPEYSERPLSALRPGDYLRLLWDLFYFPQKVRYYVSAFAHKGQGESDPPQALSGTAWRGWAETSPVQTSFLFMVAVLCIGTIFVTLTFVSWLTSALAGAEFAYGATGYAAIFGFAASIFMLACGVFARAHGTFAVFSLPIGLSFSLYFLSFDIAPRYGLDEGFLALALLCFFCGVAFGLASAGFFAAESTGWNTMGLQTAIGAVIGVLIGVTIGYTGWRDSMAGSTQSLGTAFTEIFLVGMSAFVGFLLAALRIDDFLLHGKYPGKAPSALDWSRMPRATSIPLPWLRDHITAWLDFDWERGMENVASIWWNSAQQESVRRAMHEILRGDSASNGDKTSKAAKGSSSAVPANGTAQTPAGLNERQFAIIGKIADDPRKFPWDLVTYDNAARAAILGIVGNQKKSSGATTSYAQRRLKRQQLRQRATRGAPTFPLPEKTPEQALIAGFWYLDKGYIANSAAAFKKAPDTAGVKEMQSIVDTLNTLSSEENLLSNTSVKLPARPAGARRTETWEALDKLRASMRSARIARQSVSDEKRERASEVARKLLGELASDKSSSRAELRHIRRLAELWEADLEESLVAGVKGVPLKQVDNPFIFAEPLRKGQMFVDRDAELAELKTAWMNDNLQPVILFGQPLIGKTSLLYAAATANNHVELAWFHLGHSNRERAGVRQILAAVCAAVQQATVLEIFNFAPTRTSMLPNIESATDPYAETERLIKQTCQLLAPRNLVLIMDDFDVLTQLFAVRDELNHFLDFLEHLFQTIKTFNVVFVSQFASVLFDDNSRHAFAGTARPQQLAPLERKHVAALLRPADFPLFFSDAAVEAVERLSGGHPYLVQLLAYHVVRRFNRLAAEQKGEPLIEAEDVQAILEEPEVVQRAQILFERMDQLARRAGGRAESVLDAISEAGSGLNRAELLTRMNIGVREESALDMMLFRLKRYGMIEEDGEGRWRLRNELWRKWEEGRLALPMEELVAIEERHTTIDAVGEDVEAFSAETRVFDSQELVPEAAVPNIET